MNLQQIKIARLNAQAEREILVNEMMKGTIVRWEDVLAVVGEKVVSARNFIMSLPSMYADRLTREEIEHFRKAVHAALTSASQVCDDDAVKFRNKRMVKYTKASTTIDPDEREQVQGNSLKNSKTINKPR
jgi:hypothetical protein